LCYRSFGNLASWFPVRDQFLQIRDNSTESFVPAALPMTDARHPICILTGCTAVGKTELALDWAEAMDAEIVSCDSLLFYRGMDIGTAKPTREDRLRVVHHLVDIVNVDQRMDVKMFVGLAREAIADIESRRKRVLVTGGSGFYLKAFFAAVTDSIESDLALKAELEAELGKVGLPAMVERLSKLNPGGLAGLDLQNPRRVVRALERCLVSGMTLEALAGQFANQPAPFSDFDIRLLEITREPDELRERIRMRAEQMLAGGLVEEVRSLRALGLCGNPSASRAIGYREVLAALDGPIDESALVEEISQNTWKLVRKQRTWFRTQLPAHRCIAAEDAKRAPIAKLFS
jgi:tRNA dimethylallyltransferase